MRQRERERRFEKTNKKETDREGDGGERDTHRQVDQKTTERERLEGGGRVRQADRHRVTDRPTDRKRGAETVRHTTQRGAPLEGRWPGTDQEEIGDSSSSLPQRHCSRPRRPLCV